MDGRTTGSEHCAQHKHVKRSALVLSYRLWLRIDINARINIIVIIILSCIPAYIIIILYIPIIHSATVSKDILNDQICWIRYSKIIIIPALIREMTGRWLQTNYILYHSFLIGQYCKISRNY